jgi:hypothetical protein
MNGNKYFEGGGIRYALFLLMAVAAAVGAKAQVTDPTAFASFVAFPPPGDELEVYTADRGANQEFNTIGTTTDNLQKALTARDQHAVPTGIRLGNHPNPFRNSTTIQYDVPAETWLRLSVYDANGKELLVLHEGLVAAGRYETVLHTASLPSGVLFVRLKTQTALAIRLLTYLR